MRKLVRDSFSQKAPTLAQLLALELQMESKKLAKSLEQIYLNELYSTIHTAKIKRKKQKNGFVDDCIFHLH